MIGTTISVREIEMQARAQCEAIARQCLPNAIQDGPYLKAGSIGGEKGGSLVVNLQGSSRGMWRDWSNGDQGDMIGLVEQAMFGGDRGKAVQWLKSMLGLDDLDPGRVAQIRAQVAEADLGREREAKQEAEAKKRGAQSLWLRAPAPTIAETPAAAYLTARGLNVAQLGHWPNALRYRPDVWNRDAGCKLPCLVSQMILPTGEHVATHRTFLGQDPRTRMWVKADAANVGVPRGSAKKVMGACRGAFIPLRKGASRQSMGQLRIAEPLYVTEGIEDALTVAMCKPDARVIAAYSLANLGAIEFPRTIETIVLVADRDDGRREQEALQRAIARQQARGHRVQIVLPPKGFKDMNAWLMAGAVVT